MAVISRPMVKSLDSRKHCLRDAARPFADAIDIGIRVTRIDFDYLGAARDLDFGMRQPAQSPAERCAKLDAADAGDGLACGHHHANFELGQKYARNRRIHIAVAHMPRDLARLAFEGARRSLAYHLPELVAPRRFDRNVDLPAGNKV